MHTTVYQFWRFVYHHEQYVIDHYARIYAIILYEEQIARISFIMAPSDHAEMWSKFLLFTLSMQRLRTDSGESSTFI